MPSCICYKSPPLLTYTSLFRTSTPATLVSFSSVFICLFSIQRIRFCLCSAAVFWISFHPPPLYRLNILSLHTCRLTAYPLVAFLHPHSCCISRYIHTYKAQGLLLYHILLHVRIWILVLCSPRYLPIEFPYFPYLAITN